LPTFLRILADYLLFNVNPKSTVSVPLGNYWLTGLRGRVESAALN
jgi:hypothetical protein